MTMLMPMISKAVGQLSEPKNKESIIEFIKGKLDGNDVTIRVDKVNGKDELVFLLTEKIELKKAQVKKVILYNDVVKEIPEVINLMKK
jgi:hypothetical protein